MENKGREENSNNNIQAVKPIAPVCPYTEAEQSNRDQEDNESFVRNRNMNGVEHMSFGDLLALANTASAIFFSRQTRGANSASPWIQTTNEAEESQSSVSNNVVDERIRLKRSQRRKKRSKVTKKPRQLKKNKKQL